MKRSCRPLVRSARVPWGAGCRSLEVPCGTTWCRVVSRATRARHASFQLRAQALRRLQLQAHLAPDRGSDVDQRIEREPRNPSTQKIVNARLRHAAALRCFRSASSRFPYEGCDLPHRVRLALAGWLPARAYRRSHPTHSRRSRAPRLRRLPDLSQSALSHLSLLHQCVHREHASSKSTLLVASVFSGRRAARTTACPSTSPCRSRGSAGVIPHPQAPRLPCRSKASA